MVKRCQSCTNVDFIRVNRDGVVGRVCTACQLEAIKQAIQATQQAMRQHEELAENNNTTLRN